jgi:anti-anti-sigma regulatory factor
MDRYFHVYKAGKLTVIGFDARHLSDPLCQDACRNRLLELIDAHDCEILVVDLMEVTPVTSWVIGVLAAVRRRGTGVELYHPSPVIREILETTHMNQILHIRHDVAQSEHYAKYR